MGSEERLLDLARAVADGDPVDWDRLEAGDAEPLASEVRALRRIDELRRVHIALQAAPAEDREAATATLPVSGPSRGRGDLLARLRAISGRSYASLARQIDSAWLRGLVLFALAKLSLGILAAVVAPESSAVDAGGVALWVYLLMLAAFGGAGAVLVFASREDRRAVNLGISLFLAATAFADRPLASLASAGVTVLGPLAGFFRAVPVVALLPSMLWTFAGNFPRTLGLRAESRLPQRIALLCAYLGGFLVLVNGALHFGAPGGAFEAGIRLLDRSDPASLFWPPVLALAAAAVPWMVIRSATSPPDERRRLRLFLGGIAVGVAPLSIEVLITAASPGAAEFMLRPDARLLAAFVIYPMLASIPVTTAYAVFFHGLLDVRVLVRRAFRYALARYTLLGATLLPMVLLAGHLYRHRMRTVVQLAGDGTTRVLLLLFAGGLLLVFLRRRILDALDRRFFRERHDARVLLPELAARCREAESPAVLAELLAGELDRVLHPEGIRILILDPARDRLVAWDDSIGPIETRSPLLARITRERGPLEIDSAGAVTDADRRWLSAAGARLWAGLPASDGRALAVIGLGPKRSQRPYSKEDRLLIRALVEAASLALENLLMRASATGGGSRPATARAVAHRPPDEAPASECVSCGEVGPASWTRCESCGAETATAKLPRLLQGNFRVEKRIGRGGMGVVYRGVDLELGRKVALKTLPRLSTESAWRLRREARAVAAVTHPHLAVIYGAAEWQGTPILVLEYLSAGTLADRLKESLPTLAQTLDLGIALCRALERIHAAGILHRDVKPSNVGYTAEETPKLLDFGIARMLGEPRRGAHTAPRLEPAASSGADPSALTTAMRTREGALIGTPIYMSPEAIQGREPDESFDLWSLAVLLYEAAAGKNPTRRQSVAASFDFILGGKIGDLREIRPDAPQLVARCLGYALARDRHKRPATARDFRQVLESVRARALPA